MVYLESQPSRDHPSAYIGLASHRRVPRTVIVASRPYRKRWTLELFGLAVVLLMVTLGLLVRASRHARESLQQALEEAQFQKAAAELARARRTNSTNASGPSWKSRPSDFDLPPR